MPKTKKFDVSKLLLIIVPLFFIIAVVVFLFTEDCYGSFCITGWEALKLQWPSFWIWVAIGTVAAIVCGFLAYQNEKNVGGTGKTIVLIVLAMLLMCSPWGKACGDKGNGGVTAPGHKVETPAP